MRRRGQDEVGAAIAIVLLVAVCGGRPAQAHRRDFPFTYDWYQAEPGENEIESHTTYDRTDHSTLQETEYEHGFSKRFILAPYIVYQHDAGQGFRYEGFQLESRYRIGDFATGRWLPGVYLELEKPRAETAEMEGKVIVSRFDSHDGDFSANFTLEQTLKSGTSTRKTGSFGYVLPVGHSIYDFRGGFETIRNIDDGSITLGPVLGLAATRSIFINAGYGFPMNKRAINKGEMRVLAEYEWF